MYTPTDRPQHPQQVLARQHIVSIDYTPTKSKR
jgi:hypothetical protein